MHPTLPNKEQGEFAITVASKLAPMPFVKQDAVQEIKDRLDREAEAIHDEDVASCRAMGAFGLAPPKGLQVGRTAS